MKTSTMTLTRVLHPSRFAIAVIVTGRTASYQVPRMLPLMLLLGILRVLTHSRPFVSVVSMAQTDRKPLDSTRPDAYLASVASKIIVVAATLAGVSTWQALRRCDLAQ